ncbi:MAG: hypothetical protein ACKOZX_10980, partial [Gammaproteobacteria bacterium]
MGPTPTHEKSATVRPAKGNSDCVISVSVDTDAADDSDVNEDNDVNDDNEDNRDISARITAPSASRPGATRRRLIAGCEARAQMPG